jgi:heme exporter protein C
MRKLFLPLTVVAAALFAYAPFMVNAAPYESTMGLVQKIFYFHVPSAMMMFLSAFICGIYSCLFLFRKARAADRVAVAAGELTTVFGAIVLVTGPMWALLLWLIFLGYLLVRKYGGPGSDKLAAAMAIFGMANVPFVYVSVNIWRTLHPKTSVVPSLQPGMRGPFWFCVLAFAALYALLLTLRVHLEQQRAALDELYLAHEE